MSITSQMNLAKILFTAIVTVLLASCAGEESPPSSGDPAGNTDFETFTVNAFYTKAPVDKANCTLYNKDGDVLSTPQISNKGAVQFTNMAKTEMVSLSCTGGEYTDEATNTKVELNNITMRSAVKVKKEDTRISVTPLTEIAYQLAELDGDIGDIEEHATDVADEFGLDGIDLLTTSPSPLEDITGTSKSEDKYGIVLAAISQESDTNKKNIKTLIDDKA